MKPSATRVAAQYLNLGSDPRVAGVVVAEERAPMQGMSRAKAVKFVNKVVERADTKGLFRDDHWAGVNAIYKALTGAGIEWNINDSKYERDGGMMPIRKVWNIWVPFVSDKGKADNVYIRIVAAGAGSVADPLDTYDVVAYAT